jgi:RNA polymerase sigma factor (sigma-70 family)
MNPVSLHSDADLVAACLEGDRHAFAHIVERYQRLLCSLAYSATGGLAESEDLAQEAFLTAWQKLGELREPEKLRAWLCGIVRHKINRRHRKASREPNFRADPIENDETLPHEASEATAYAMNEEETALMWSALKQVPELYREPLVLYYREHQSIEHVADALDLSEAAVKQRLSRGRKMLQERVLSLVEGALTRSTPGAIFTAGVMASIATLAPPAKAAVVGAGVGGGAIMAKGGMAMKWLGLASLLASISGLISTVFALRASFDQTRTRNERRYTVKTVALIFATVFALVGSVVILRIGAQHWWPQHAHALAIAVQVPILAFVVLFPIQVSRVFQGMRRLRGRERSENPDAFSDPRDAPGHRSGEYRSKLRLFGLPLVHIRFAAPEENDRPVVAWIAGGDRAIGVLFAWGGWAVGLVSVGIVSVGVVSLGTLGFGVIGLGAVAFGWVALGAMTYGFNALASLCAVGWESAQSGGFAIARLAARGNIAFAEHANDAWAADYFANPRTDLFVIIGLFTITVLTIAPAFAYALEVRRRLGRKL